MPKKLSARDWLKRIDRSKKYRDQIKDKQEWSDILDCYKGDYKTKGNPIKSPPINIVYGYVQTGIARIYFRDPHISVNPVGAEFLNSARIKELQVNQDFKELGLKNQAERVLIDTFLIGHGWIKVGYHSEIGEKTGESPNEKSEYIKKEGIFAEFVPWEDVLFDIVLCKDPPHDCGWIAHRIVRPIEEIKNSSKYKHTDKLKANVTEKDYRGEKVDETMKDQESELVEFWEIWDMENKKIICVVQESDDFIREEDNKLEMTGSPFSMLKFNLVSGEPYPMSDIFIIKPQILERIKLRAGMLNHIKRWSRQLSIEKGAMTKEEMEKFEQGQDGAVTQREKGFAPPVAIEYANLQGEIFGLDDLIQKDMDAVIGQTQVDRGGQAPQEAHGKKLKYELQQEQSASQGRQGKRQDRLEDFLEEVADKIIALRQQFQDTPKYVPLEGMKPEEISTQFPGLESDGMGVSYTKQNLQGKHTVDAKVGSTLPMNRENRIKIIEALLQQGPAVGIVPGSPVSFELGKELIRELDLKGVEKAYEQQIQMMEQQAQNPQPPPQPQAPPTNIQHHVNYQAPAGALPPGLSHPMG